MGLRAKRRVNCLLTMATPLIIRKVNFYSENFHITMVNLLAGNVCCYCFIVSVSLVLQILQVNLLPKHG